MLTDIEIAKSVKLRPINDVASELGIQEEVVENYGRFIAKISTNIIDKKKFKNHHLILVTAISPTKAGNGKTTVSVGLAKDRQEGCISITRAILRSLFRYEGRSCRRWLCSGTANG